MSDGNSADDVGCWLTSKCSIVTTFFVVLLFVYYRYATWTHDTFKKLGIRGPKPWPGLGNFVSLYRTGMLKYDVEMKKKYGSIYGVFFGKQPFMVVYDTAILKQIMVKDFQYFPNHFDMGLLPPPMDKALSLLKDDHWKFVRSVVSPTFSSGKMRKMSGQINKCCQTLCENLSKEAESKKIFDFKIICDAFTMDTIASTAFGVSIDSHNDPNNIFVLMARKVFKVKMTLGGILLLVAPFLVKPLMRLGVPMFERDFIEFFTDVAKKAISQKDSADDKRHLDFLQILLNAHKENARDEDGLSEEEILAQCLLFFLVGFETTSTTLSYFGYNMACNPDQQEKLYEEIVEKIGDKEPTYDSILQLSFLDMCLNETLRMFPIGVRLETDRQATEDVTINGVLIPKGMVVLIPIYAIHNDPEFWPEPHVFKPERFSPENWNPSTSDPLRFMPFGAGPRNCVGMRLAKMEVKMAVIHMIRNFRFVVSEETDVPPVFERFTIKNINGIKIRVERR
ncbi:hypothetical protein HELRODRAFT_96929 [Helobdella robusta]|uniref:Uncharacterized protein n=1 Tax=Helobdella robusta TaxID=6412 RepID=T1G9E4_HELRO|nr:hypothetical protein HELRODRAFT_96929 [Helobdella robusta]ESO10629.1 hypothetical protein HELRODRAFT_96929 [Helobdella robusta]